MAEELTEREYERYFFMRNRITRPHSNGATYVSIGKALGVTPVRVRSMAQSERKFDNSLCPADYASAEVSRWQLLRELALLPILKELAI